MAGRFSAAGVTTPEAAKLPNFVVSLASFAFCGRFPSSSIRAFNFSASST